MIPVHLAAIGASQQAAREKLLAQLREAGATSAAMPASVELDGDEAEQAMSQLLEAGTVREARRGLYFIDESKRREGQDGLGFKLLLILLVCVSIMASAVAMLAAGD